MDEEPQATAVDEQSEYTTRSTSLTTAKVSDVVLDRSDGTGGLQSRKVLRAEIIEDNKTNPAACLKIKLAYQKKHSKGTVPDEQAWNDLDRIQLRSLKQGESIEIDLDTSQTYLLRQELEKLYTLANKGVTLGRSKTVVISGDQADLHRAISKVDLTKYKSNDIVQVMEKLAPGLLESAAIAEMHRKRCEALGEFERHMAVDDWSEGDWEQFFRRNEWIFGHGLAYRFMTEVQSQASLGGTSIDGTGTHRSDFVMASKAKIRFTAIVDIKKPSTQLLHTKSKYRNKVYMISAETAGGVSQVQAYCRTWTIDGARQEDNKDALESAAIYTVQPKGILVIGNTNQLNDRDKRHSFELFRCNLSNPEILTFDELFERAKMLVLHDSETSTVASDTAGSAHD